MPQVALVMGSKSDEPVLQEALKVLEEMGISYEVHVLSAHRTPDKVREFARTAQERGVEVIIAAAGGAAALPGVVAAYTTLPVIGVPLPSSPLQGLDALLAIAQMPPGVPVGCMAIGSWGARNAAYFAAAILGLKHEAVRKAYQEYKRRLAQ
jgi:5-(carboxyamino)imidazole ribonucleotide mutase